MSLHFNLGGFKLDLGKMMGMRMGPRDPNSTPWLDDKRWKQGRISRGGGEGIFGLAFFTLFWNGIVWFIGGMMLLNPDNVEGDIRVGIAVLAIFGLIGLGFLYALVLSVLRWIKFGKSTLVLATFPGEIGGRFKATLQVPEHAKPQKGYNVTLSCIHRKVTGSGKHRKVRMDTIWEDKRVEHGHISMTTKGKQMCVPVEFDIPDHVPETDNRISRDQIIWRTKIEADIPGLDVHAEFDVPVFKLA